MAVVYRAETGDLIKLLLDSRSEDEFEGFEPEDMPLIDTRPQYDDTDTSGWVQGDRDQPATQFNTSPGLVQSVPDDRQPL